MIESDAVIACADLAGRTGAKEFQVGYLHDDVPVEQAGWYAHAQYQGARISAGDRASPDEACDALARKLLTGAQCQHCKGLVALGDDGAAAYPGLMANGKRWTEAEIRAAGGCRWRRMGDRWVRGCAGSTKAPGGAQ